jgi:hypothetical protein
MNALIERVNAVCHAVRLMNQKPINFKKLVTQLRREFKLHDFDLAIRTKKEKFLGNCEFYVNAYYDAEDDFMGFTPIEVVIHHNFLDTDEFYLEQITDFLIQIFDAVVHEYKHQKQSAGRSYEVFSDHDQSPYEDYLADPDELDAYALSITIELLRYMSKERAQRYMSRITVMSKMRKGTFFVSPNLNAYIAHFGLSPLVKRLAKKVYKHLETIDKRHIFV